MRKLLIAATTWLVAASLLLSACRSTAPSQSGRLKVVATTTLVGDAVQQVGGEMIELVVLLPVGSDPHTFEPRPQDIAALSEAQLVFTNGFGLEETLEPVLQANLNGTRVEVSSGITPLAFEAEHPGETEHNPAAGDPHTWMDPNNVRIWVENIAQALALADPANAQTYRSNAQAYQNELTALDAWIREQVAMVPVDQRKLVTDHATLGYFAQAYGFEQSGLVVASFSSNAAPSAQELAQLENTIREQGVRALFVSSTINPGLAKQVAQDTGASVVSLYTGSLSQPGGEADTYLSFMRYNVNAIIQALK